MLIINMLCSLIEQGQKRGLIWASSETWLLNTVIPLDTGIFWIHKLDTFFGILKNPLNPGEIRCLAWKANLQYLSSD